MEGVKTTSSPQTPSVGVPLDQIKRFDGVLISNPILIYGYPTSLGLVGPLTRPLLRRGSSLERRKERRQLLLTLRSMAGTAAARSSKSKNRAYREVSFGNSS